MKSIFKNSAISVFTARGIEMILADGGSQAWVLDAKRARGCEYVVCVQNCGKTDDWGHVSAPHHTAFLVGRLKDVVHSDREDCDNRWLLTFSEYAEVDIADAWPGYRNPVFYTDLEHFGIDLNTLQFHPMPLVQEPVLAQKTGAASAHDGPLTIAQAKRGLAITFGVEPADIDITVRG